MRLTRVGVDADDPLWRHETVFRLTQDRRAELRAPYAERSDLDTTYPRWLENLAP